MATSRMYVEDIRKGDTVTDTDGTTYIAWRDAVYVPETGYVNVVDTGYGHHDYTPDVWLTVTYQDIPEVDYAESWY